MTDKSLQKTIPQTQAMFDKYGELNGDNDIIHYDDAYAKERGFRGTLGHGLMYTGYVCDLAAKKYGADWHYRGRLTVKYVRGVCPGDNLQVIDRAGRQGRVQIAVRHHAGRIGDARMNEPTKKGPVTRTGASTATTIRVRGRDMVNELIGHYSFTEMLYFLTCGKFPTPAADARSSTPASSR